MTGKARALDLLLGGDGPEVRTPPGVALLLAGWARPWLEARKSQLGREHLPLLAEAEAWVEAVERAAVLHRRVLMSAGGAVDGHLDLTGVPAADDRSVTAWLTSTEVAEVLGVTPRHVGRLRDAGLLDARRPGREWFYDSSSVERYQRGAAA